MKRLGEFILAYPRFVMLSIAVLAFLAVFPGSQITTDFNLEGFYPDDDPVIKDYEILEDEFGRDDNTILIGFKHDELFSAQVLSDLLDLTRKLEEIEQIEEVFSLWNASSIDSDGNRLTFDPWLEEESFQVADLDRLKERMTSDPFLRGFLLSDDGTATAIVLRIDEEQNTYSDRNHIINRLDEILADGNGYSYHISGIPYFRNQYVNMLNGEIVMYIGISSILIILLLWAIYRTIWGILFPMLIVWATLLFTVALIQLTGGFLEIMSSTIAPILLCVGVADAVHMISKYDDSRESGMNKRKSILEMLQTLGSATLLTSITTAIGFATLMTSTVMPMKRFGAYTAAGVLIAYLITILFLPAALNRSKKKRVFDEKSGQIYPFLQKLLTKVAAVNRLHYRKVLWIGVGITVLFGIGIQNVQVNGKVFDDVGDDTVLMQDSRFFTEQISPQFPMEFIIRTGEPDGVMSQDLMERIEEMEDLLISYSEIHRVTGLHTLMKEVHYVFGEENSPERVLPGSDQAIAQYLLLLEVNDSDELYRLVDFDYSTLRVTAFTEDAGSKRINEIRDEIEPQIRSLFEEEEVIITGTTILSADLTEKIVYSLAWSIALALTAITLIMAMLFKNIRLVIIALIPNLLPLIIVAGVMGFMGVDIKPSTAVIFTIALGIAVDDSIHYLARFRIEYLRRGAIFPALTATTIRTGRAIIVTSLILIAGFGTLITSAFTSTAMMGILVCATIFGALISDLFILPALFYWLKPKLGIGSGET
ncbi:MAG: MMPL family transporter [Balneolaceae bacterium]|nr:MMPL family transporter [Balneolaceae bacterium]MCH8550166.1 MMPL family transporter [Balneolaceae bacterium]